MALLGGARRRMTLGIAACLAGGCGAPLGVVGMDPHPGGPDLEIVALTGRPPPGCSDASSRRGAARRPRCQERPHGR
jgi:hypothetical protein